MKKLLFTLLLCCCANFWVPPVQADDAGQAEVAKTAPTVFRTLDIGDRSGCTRPAKMLITDEKEWLRVWALHMQGQTMKLSAPPVDFSREAVVALLMGDQPEGAAIAATQIVNGSQDVAVYYAAQAGRKGAPAMSQPYHFAAISKPTGKLRFTASVEDCLTCRAR